MAERDLTNLSIKEYQDMIAKSEYDLEKGRVTKDSSIYPLTPNQMIRLQIEIGMLKAKAASAETQVQVMGEVLEFINGLKQTDAASYQKIMEEERGTVNSGQTHFTRLRDMYFKKGEYEELEKQFKRVKSLVDLQVTPKDPNLMAAS